MAELDKSLIFALIMLTALVVGSAAGMSRGVQKMLFALLILTTMKHIADIQLGYEEVVGRRRQQGTVWGFRYTFNDMMAMPLFLGLLIQSALTPARFRWFPKGALAILFLFFAETLSLLAADSPVHGLFELHNVLLGYVVFTATANFVRSEGDLKFAIGLLVICAAVQGVIGVKQHYQYLLGLPYMSRVRGLTVHANLLSLYLNTLLPLCLVLALSATRLRHRLFLIGVCVLGSAAVLFTLSRGGVAGVLFGYGIACLLWLFFSRAGYKLPKLVFISLLLMAIGVKWTPLLIERIESRNAQASSVGRQGLTDRGFEVWRTSPMIGVGVNNYSRLERTANVHNTYVLYLAELGVIGFFALVVLFASFAFRAVGNLWRAPPHSFLRLVNIGFVGGLAALYLQLYAEFAIRSENIHYLFHILGGLIAASSYLIAQERQKAEPAPSPAARRRRVRPEPAVVRV